MSAPKANLNAALKKKQAQEPKSGGVASTFRSVNDKGPTKKATYEIPMDLHRTLHIHAVTEGVPMRDLVVKYIADGLRNDGKTV